MLGLGIILFLLVGLRVLAIFLLGNNPEYRDRKKEWCKPHSWSYNKDDKLECIECGFIAGLIEND